MFFRNSKKLNNFFETLKLNLLSGRGYYYYVYIYIINFINQRYIDTRS